MAGTTIISKKPRVQPGQEFDRLTVQGCEFWIRRDRQARTRMAVVKCQCGTIKAVPVRSLIEGGSRSCGCLQKEIVATLLSARTYEHGQSHGRLHSIWTHMLQRCGNPNNPAFKHYGGRGITVCAEWRKFVAFWDWSLKNGYGDTLSIDRIDNNQGYSPGNCRWVGMEVQSNNTRSNVPLTAFGETKNVKQWANDPRCVVSYAALRVRLGLGWQPEQAISEPKQGKLFACFGEAKSLLGWSKDARCQVPYQTLHSRVFGKKWSIERAVTTPKLNQGAY